MQGISTEDELGIQKVSKDIVNKDTGIVYTQLNAVLHMQGITTEDELGIWEDTVNKNTAVMDTHGVRDPSQNVQDNDTGTVTTQGDQETNNAMPGKPGVQKRQTDEKIDGLPGNDHVNGAVDEVIARVLRRQEERVDEMCDRLSAWFSALVSNEQDDQGAMS